jgi:peptidoglycan hydrolase FlgJ
MEVTAANLAQWNVAQSRLELPSGDGESRLEAVAQEFESLFVKQMLDSMRDTLNKEEDIFNGGMAQDIFEDMLYDEYSRILSRSGSLGIADLLVEQYRGSVATPAAAASLYESV